MFSTPVSYPVNHFSVEIRSPPSLANSHGCACVFRGIPSPRQRNAREGSRGRHLEYDTTGTRMARALATAWMSRVTVCYLYHHQIVFFQICFTFIFIFFVLIISRILSELKLSYSSIVIISMMMFPCTLLLAMLPLHVSIWYQCHFLSRWTLRHFFSKACF